MRPLSEIKEQINKVHEEYRLELENLRAEIKEIQHNCPHPAHFLKVDHADYEDSGPGVPRYEYSITKVTCILCEKTAYSDDYNKEKGSKLFEVFRPDPETIINKK